MFYSEMKLLLKLFCTTDPTCQRAWLGCVCITVVPVRAHGAEAYCHGSILGIDQPLVFY